MKITLKITKKITVPAHERAVQYVDGAFVAVLAPGRHRVRRQSVVHRVSVLQRLLTTAPQEVLTADGLGVRVTAVVRHAVVDPRAYLEVSDAPLDVVYLATQVALRDALVGVEAEVLARDARRAVGDALLEPVRAAASGVGVAVTDALVKDVVLPHELRAAYADVVAAKARGLAKLETARAETAALRTLANAAKLLDDHPALARLRLVEALPHGSTLELGLDPR